MNATSVRDTLPTPRVGGTVARFAVPTVVVVALCTVFLGFAHKSICLTGDFEELTYRAYCYTDVVPLYRQDGFAAGRVPYLDGRNEYPVATGLFMWVASLPARGEATFFLTNALGLAVLAVATAWLLARRVGLRALSFAAAPSLFLYAFLNWDLPAVFLATAGTLAFLRRRDVGSGILLGLGAAAKIYPGLLLIPFALERLRTGERAAAARLAAAGACTWLVVNAPFAILGRERWTYFFRFNSARPPTSATFWYPVCRAVTGTPSCNNVTLINVASLMAFVVLSAVLWRIKARREPSFPRWTFGFPLLVAFLLTNKVYSPQYSLWLLPWFALVLPNLRLFALFEAADVAVFVTEFSYLGGSHGLPGMPLWALVIPLAARAAVLIAILADYVRVDGAVRGAPAAPLVGTTISQPW
jgi:uncharacterized membrane protein